MRKFIALFVMLAVAIPAAVATAGSGTDRATGGGQVLASSDAKGAGDTIAFTARGTSDAATGQIQYVKRTGGTGVGQTVLHGTVDCIDAQGNTAKLAGEFENGQTYTLLVEDNGQGGNDMIALQKNADPTCDRKSGDDDGSTALARGNAQVYDAQQ